MDIHHIHVVGPDGVGKTPVANALGLFLEYHGIPTCVYPFPTKNSPFATSIRSNLMLPDGDPQKLSDTQMGELFREDRLWAIPEIEKIRRLHPGIVFIFDRSAVDGIVYTSGLYAIHKLHLLYPFGDEFFREMERQEAMEQAFLQQVPLDLGIFLTNDYLSRYASSQRIINERNASGQDTYDRNCSLQFAVRDAFNLYISLNGLSNWVTLRSEFGMNETYGSYIKRLLGDVVLDMVAFHKFPREWIRDGNRFLREIAFASNCVTEKGLTGDKETILDQMRMVLEGPKFRRKER